MPCSQKLLIAFLTAVFFISPIKNGFSQNFCLDFDGTDDAIDLGNTVGNDIRTIEFWFRPDLVLNSSTVNSFIALVVRDGSPAPNGYGVAFNHLAPNQGKLRFALNTGVGAQTIFSNSDSWNAGQWYHVAAVVDPVSGMKLYIDGTLQTDTNTYTDDTNSNLAESTAIGRWGDRGDLTDRHFDGKIDDVRLWSIARSETEILTTMNCFLAGTELGLNAYYSMDNTSSFNDVVDESGNSNHGTRVGPLGPNNLPQYMQENRLLEACPTEETIPTVSQWGLFVLGLLLSCLGIILLLQEKKEYSRYSK